ncbi:MAG: toxin-antitoxin system HicB family antitoxin [Lachnospiraceae bacterium]|nr:toxin-antitoxin system HicB family antitoxin [Lachnospiraceae bacterium]
MFKVEKKNYINKTFRIEENLLRRLEQVAAEEKISVNALVVQCCQYALDDMNINTTPSETHN